MRRPRVHRATARQIAALAAVLAATLPAHGVLRCHESAGFRVVERSRDDGPGTDFLVQALAPDAPRAACRYRRVPGDFEIPSRDAESFAALAGERLVIDNGTGPQGRRLIVWDLRARAQVLDTPLGQIIEVTPQRLRYWRPDAQPADDANCPQRQRWKAELLGAGMQRQVELDLATLAPHALDQWRCVARQ